MWYNINIKERVRNFFKKYVPFKGTERRKNV